MKIQKLLVYVLFILVTHTATAAMNDGAGYADLDEVYRRLEILQEKRKQISQEHYVDAMTGSYNPKALVKKVCELYNPRERDSVALVAQQVRNVLTSDNGLKVEDICDRGLTTLHVAVSGDLRKEIPEIFLQAAHDPIALIVKQTDDSLSTALHFVAFWKRTDIIKLLFKYAGYNNAATLLGVLNKKQQTVCRIAYDYSKRESFDLLTTINLVLKHKNKEIFELIVAE